MLIDIFAFVLFSFLQFINRYFLSYKELESLSSCALIVVCRAWVLGWVLIGVVERRA